MQPTASPFRDSCKKVASFRPRSSFQLSCHTSGDIRTGFGSENSERRAVNVPTGRPRLRTTSLRSREGSLARSNEPEQERCHLAHLNLLAALRNAVAPMVPVDVFEGLVAGVTDPAMYLHGAISRFTAKPVGPVVA